MKHRQPSADCIYLPLTLACLALIFGCEQKTSYTIQTAPPQPAPSQPAKSPQTSWSAQANQEKGVALKGVALKGVGVTLHYLHIPHREHGYSKFDSMLLQTSDEIESFLKDVRQQEHWNRRDDFIAAFENAKIDTDDNALLLIRNTQGSGSIKTWLETPRLVGRELVFRVERNQPVVGTMDMAFYCHAVVIPRLIADSIRVKGANTQSRYVLDNNGKQVLRKAHSNDLFFLLKKTPTTETKSQERQRLD